MKNKRFTQEQLELITYKNDFTTVKCADLQHKQQLIKQIVDYCDASYTNSYKNYVLANVKFTVVTNTIMDMT